MTQDQVKSDAGSSYFIQEHSVPIRIWHWLTFILITSAMITVLLNSTLMNPRKNIGMVQEQLKAKGVTVTEDQAFGRELGIARGLRGTIKNLSCL